MFAPIRPVRASSDVIAQIRRAILSGQFRPGDRLPTERDMAQQFGVSRVTVRDAPSGFRAYSLEPRFPFFRRRYRLLVGEQFVRAKYGAGDCDERRECGRWN